MWQSHLISHSFLVPVSRSLQVSLLASQPTESAAGGESCREPAISHDSHHVSLVQWTNLFASRHKGPRFKSPGGTYVKPGFSLQFLQNWPFLENLPYCSKVNLSSRRPEKRTCQILRSYYRLKECALYNTRRFHVCTINSQLVRHVYVVHNYQRCCISTNQTNFAAKSCCFFTRKWLTIGKYCFIIETT